MADYDIRFFEYLAQGQSEALRDRESRILELRYGLTGENAATLAAIGKVFGVSRERIRQILGKAHRKVYSKGQRQLKANNVNDPCTELLTQVLHLDIILYTLGSPVIRVIQTTKLLS